VVTTLAGVAGVSGSTDGTGAAARFNNPNGIALDAAGNLYVADTGNQVIRLVTPAGVVTTVAGTALTAGAANGAGNAATFYWPMGIAVNAAGTMAYVTDYGSSTVRTISTSAAPMTSANTTVATLAGTAGMSGSANGTGASARFFGPQGLALDASGNLYIADSWNNAIRYINTTSGAVSTLTGMAGVAGSANGALAAATFYAPLDIAIDSQNNLYVADAGNSLIRKITLSSGTVSTVAGAVAQDIFSAGPLSQATLWQPTALAISGTAPSATLVLTTGNGVASINAVP
jgi:DNA-binding beta-propeller fold protein YncE